VQAPGDWLNYNRYSYGYNNPLIYTDPSGEYVLIDDIIAAALGSVINVVVNAFQGNLGGHGVWGGIGRGFAAFGAGAVAGWGALYPEFGGWVWGGATVGATNSWLNGAKGWDIAIGAGVGVFSGVVGGIAGQWGAQYLGGIAINGFNITSPIAQGAITGALGGAVGGYAGGFSSGLLMTGDLGEANKAGWQGAAFGAPIGATTGSVSAYRYAIKNDISPWTGKDLNVNYSLQNEPNKSKWNYGDHKSHTKWENQMNQRGWSEQQINEAIRFGDSHPAINKVNPNNGATRYVHPTTGRSIVIDNTTGSLLQVGGDGFLW